MNCSRVLALAAASFAMFEGEYQYHEDVNWGLLRLWGKRTGLRVLDVGCGFATTSERIQKLGNDVTGIDSSDEITVQAGEQGIRFLLVSGRPLEEPVAWYGPIVMNTRAELQQAFDEFRNGTFIKHAGS